MPGLFDALRRRRQRPLEAPALPRAGGVPREVDRVVGAAIRQAGRRFLPVEDCPTVGALLEVDVLGPGLVRPGESPAPGAGPVRRMARLTVLRQGALEHRDSLGHRGLLRAPAVHLVSGGAGVLSEIGLAREVRRDGGDVEVFTIAWVQPDPITPTVRLADAWPLRSQGRSRVSLLVGPDAAIPSAAGYEVSHVAVAAGATVDLPVDPDADVVVVVLAGTALIGRDLLAVPADDMAILTGEGTRVTIATRLEDDMPTQVLVLSTPRSAIAPFLRQANVIGADAEDLQSLARQVAEGSLGRLPRLDG